MSNIRIAIKPKYPTRRATDKVLFNEGNFLDVIDEYSDRHILSILDTAHVALIDTAGKYYPVNKDNYKEQFALAVAGEVPTVDADEKFGVKKMENFITASTSETAKKIQDCAIYNGILTGQLFKVTDFKKIGDEKINKNGFWMMFEYDKAGAEAEGYSKAHILCETEELVDGTNYIYFGTDDASLNYTFFGIDSTLTVDGESGDNLAIFDNSLICKVLIDTDDLPNCMLNGIQYEELSMAIAAASSGDVIDIYKSITVPKTITINSGKNVVLKLVHGVTVTINGYFMVTNGSLTITGEGTVKEAKPHFAPVILKNTDENVSANVHIGSDITLWGWAGLMFDGKSVNLNARCCGHVVGNNDGSGNGIGVYCNGNVLQASMVFVGSTEGTVGTGMYLAGNIGATISNSIIEGTDSGIELRAGTVDICNSKVISTNTGEPTMTPSGNGTTAMNVAFAVAQHTTKKNVNAIINNCILTGSAAFMEGNPQKNPEATNQTTIIIKNGTTLNGKVLTLDPENDCKNFIYDARCTEDPDEKYLAKGYKTEKNFTGTFEVVKE